VVNTPEIRVPCPEDRKRKVVEEIKARLIASGAEVNDIDGVRVRQDGGWWLLRASNTQDILVVRCEAPDGETLQSLVGRVRDELAACGLTLPT
jgi:phosphomannomutase